MISHQTAMEIDRRDRRVACWPCHRAEAVASEASSASCQDRLEDVRILTVVMPELELREIERQVFLAYVMERAHDAALQERPEGIDILGMNLAAPCAGRPL
jgi:hypothetical protein